MQGFRSAFPDLTLTVTNQVASESSVVNEFVVRGTHKGALVGPAGAIPATGKKIDYPVIEVWDIKNGKLAGIRNYFDTGTMMRQLSVAPAPK